MLVSPLWLVLPMVWGLMSLRALRLMPCQVRPLPQLLGAGVEMAAAKDSAIPFS